MHQMLKKIEKKVESVYLEFFLENHIKPGNAHITSDFWVGRSSWTPCSTIISEKKY